ncbi:hypothetical protein HYH02_014678 [Chlamydomonas schloesseri]|uniref:Carbohydrate kinase PfkB domain-containing protein n=1 Tax=Chlamydomonas schloesseri TaxID=2026947 RepID=A0A835VRY7_9CHLO|nr:hypothetical protein HYH02_014678 [Chlamydomonas schloesseri]|eukprot:KAG2427032.1 hypothetical protein HYH02_014678 [Chlamydomonas schloesseri]
MKHWAVLLVPLVALIGYFASELGRVDLLLVGTITVDVVDDGSRPAGGAVSYAASIARAYGIRACVVSVAGEDADLSVFAGHELHVVPAAATLTFEHTYTWFGHQRKLRVTANPNVTLSRAHVPRHCQRARTVILGPLTQHELDAASFLEYDSMWDALFRGRQHIGLMAQGFQRRLGPDGRVLPLLTPSPQLLSGLGRSRRVSLFLSDVETEPWSEDWLGLVVGSAERVLITRGSAGATEYNDTGVHDIHIVPVDKVRDTNGAGDTFATGYMLALARGLPDPGAHASWAASRAVMQPQSCKPHCAGDLIEGHVPAWRPADRLAAAAHGLGAAARGLVDRGLREGLAAALHLRQLPPGTLTQMAAKATAGAGGGAAQSGKKKSGGVGGKKLAAGPADEEDDDDDDELASVTVATVTL